MKKIITIGMCLFICFCANHVFGFGIISSNGGFEIAGSGAGAAEAAGWSGTPDSALSRSSSAAHSGLWSMELLGGHWDWSHCTQAYNEEDYVGLEIFATVWVMSPSNSSAVAVNDQFGNNSVIFKLEEAGTINPLAEAFGILNVDAGGVRDQWICLTNKIPVMPAMPATGIKTAIRTSGVAITGAVTLAMASSVACLEFIPLAIFTCTASTTTIASSTTIPIASTSPRSDNTFIVNPSIGKKMKAPTRDTGIASVGISVARQS